jgi:cyclic pyranopterin phosphate synthase
LRRDLEILIGRLANIPGVDDLAMTTNGIGFVSRAQRLKDSGLRRVTFSLDSLARGVFKTLTGRDALNAVLESIQVAQKLKFEPLKINVVLIRGINDTEILPLVEFARERDIAIRFIEFMPLDSKRSWQRDLVIASNEILDVVKSKYSIVSSDRENPSDTAKKWEFSDGRGGLGIIAPITDPFCGNCNRLRLTADGKIRTCLFSTGEHDVRGLLRQECSDEELKVYLESIVLKKEVGHRIGREDFVPPARSMSYIGG